MFNVYKKKLKILWGNSSAGRKSFGMFPFDYANQLIFFLSYFVLILFDILSLLFPLLKSESTLELKSQIYQMKTGTKQSIAKYLLLLNFLLIRNSATQLSFDTWSNFSTWQTSQIFLL